MIYDKMERIRKITNSKYKRSGVAVTVISSRFLF